MNKKTVVVCDDNSALTGLMQHLLRKQGFSVLTAENGSEALEQIRSSRPHLLLLDLAMPGTDGLAVLEALKTGPSPRPYTIVVSAQEGQYGRERALALGSDEVWRKPFNAAELLGRIESLIAKGTI
ncbi:MAG: response regulator transcription factor [Elusimicrobia bacterium]|nr:response regulator transcription factor [Elusimicrobiota bacterium]